MTLQRGETAADFVLLDHSGQECTLADLLRSGPVLLVFFPFAFSPVCHEELTLIAEREQELRAGGVSVVAVSCDPIHALRAYAEKNHLEFPLLSDFWPHGEVATRFGVFNDVAGHPRRVSFLISPEHTVSAVWEAPIWKPRDFDDYLEHVLRST